MSLKVRKYKFEEGDSHDIFELELTPEMVDGVEVYNIEAVVSDSTGIVGKSEKLHYGYLSKEMADFLDQRNEFGFANIERLSLKSPIKYPDEIANLSQKIIIDRHPEAGNAIPQISLDPIKYSDKLEPTITVAIKNFFNVSTADAPIIFKFNDNKLLCDSFYIIDTNDEGTTTIDLNIENNRADMVSINRIQPIRAFSKDAYFSYNGGEYCNLDIKTLVVPAKGLNGEVLKIRARDGMEVFSSSLRFRTNASDMSGEFNVEGHLLLDMALLEFDNFDPDNKPILNVGSDCKIDNVQGEIHSENNFASALYLLKHRKKQSQQAQIFFNKADVQSPLELQPDASGDVELIINQSTIKNRGKKIFIRGNETCFYKSYVENDGVEGLQIRSSDFIYSRAINTKIFTNAHLIRAEVENCEIINEEFERNGLVRAGVIFIGPMQSDYDERNIEDEDEKQLPTIKMRDSKIELGRDDVFDMRSDAEVNANNISSNGSFDLFVPAEAKVNMRNSVFNNADMSFVGTSKLEISDTEIKGKLEALALSNIEGSVLSNVKLCDITSVENSFLEDFSTANTPFSRIKDYNSNSKEEPKNDLASPMTTTDFEAL